MLGKVLDHRYQIESVLGQGGMGMVFLATQVAVKRPVALKTLHPNLAAAPQFFERFRREAEIASRLRHPNIITIFDFGKAEDGTCYFVMELVPGQSLKQLVKAEGALSIRRAMNIIEQAARGLGTAHADNVVHRDVKPHNLLVSNVDGKDFVKILDFGLVKALEVEDEDQLTSTGQVLGTPQYMPPEQAGGEAVDARSDLYSLAGVFYFCLTGTSPFGANTVRKALTAALTQQVPPVHTKRVGAPVPRQLDEFFRKALASDKENRHQNAEEFIADMKAAVAGLSDVELEAVPDPRGAAVDGEPRGTPATPSASQRGGKMSNVIVDPVLSRAGSDGEVTRPKTRATAPEIPALKPGSLSEPGPHRRRKQLTRRLAFVGVPVALLAIGGAIVYRQQTQSPPHHDVALESHHTTLEKPVAADNVKPTQPHDPKPDAMPNTVVVKIKTRPVGAAVFDNNVLLGTTPLDLQMGRDRVHTLTFRMDGYSAAAQYLDLAQYPETIRHVDVDLQPVEKVQAPKPRKQKKVDIPVFE